MPSQHRPPQFSPQVLEYARRFVQYFEQEWENPRVPGRPGPPYLLFGLDIPRENENSVDRHEVAEAFKHLMAQSRAWKNPSKTFRIKTATGRVGDRPVSRVTISMIF